MVPGSSSEDRVNHKGGGGVRRNWRVKGRREGEGEEGEGGREGGGNLTSRFTCQHKNVRAAVAEERTNSIQGSLLPGGLQYRPSNIKTPFKVGFNIKI